MIQIIYKYNNDGSDCGRYAYVVELGRVVTIRLSECIGNVEYFDPAIYKLLSQACKALLDSLEQHPPPVPIIKDDIGYKIDYSRMYR